MPLFVISVEWKDAIVEKPSFRQAIEQTYPEHLQLTDHCYLIEAKNGDHPQDVLDALQTPPYEALAHHRLVALHLDDAPPLYTTLAFTNAYASTAEGKNFVQQRKNRSL